jgi:hypothetical protein
MNQTGEDTDNTPEKASLAKIHVSMKWMLVGLPVSLLLSIPIALVIRQIPKSWGKHLFAIILVAAFILMQSKRVSELNVARGLFIAMGLAMGGLGWLGLYGVLITHNTTLDPTQPEARWFALIFWGKMLVILLTFFICHALVYYGFSLRPRHKQTP